MKRSRLALHLALGLAGAGALALMLRGLDPRAVAAAAGAFGPWLPLVLALEGVRIVLETGATKALYGPLGASLPLSSLVRVHLWGYAVATAMPAGRPLAEAGKAAALAPHVGGARGASVGATAQALGLIATGLASAPCALVALGVEGPTAFAGALALHGVLVGGLGVALLSLGRRPGLWAFLARRVPSLAGSLGEVHAHLRALPSVPWRALGWLVANRAVQFAELMVLLGALGALTPERVALCQGAMFVGSALGDLVPGQLGATDGALAIAAPLVGLHAAQGVALALALHAVQVCWVLAGALSALVWRDRAGETTSGALRGP